MNALYRWVLPACLLLTSFAPLQAQSLADRVVLLVVSQERNDATASELEGRLTGLRADLGLQKSELPFVFMGFEESNREIFSRLGFSAQDSPVVCVVRWGRDDSYGPAQVVNGAIRRGLNGDQAQPALVGLLRDWLKGTGRHALVGRLPGPTQGALEVLEVDLKARGEPFNMLTFLVTLGNQSSAPTPDSFAHVLVQPGPQHPWLMLTSFKVRALKPGAQAKEGDVVSLRQFPQLLTPGGEVTRYRARLLLNGETVWEGPEYEEQEVEEFQPLPAPAPAPAPPPPPNAQDNRPPPEPVDGTDLESLQQRLDRLKGRSD